MSLFDSAKSSIVGANGPDFELCGQLAVGVGLRGGAWEIFEEPIVRAARRHPG